MPSKPGFPTPPPIPLNIERKEIFIPEYLRSWNDPARVFSIVLVVLAQVPLNIFNGLIFCFRNYFSLESTGHYPNIPYSEIRPVVFFLLFFLHLVNSILKRLVDFSGAFFQQDDFGLDSLNKAII